MRTRLVVGLVFACVVVGGALLARSWRHPANAEVADTAAVPTVAVARVSREDLFKEIAVPAEFRPYTDVEVHAKVSGFVKKINVDIGDRVKAGQLLATLEVPELTDDLDSARAALRRADAEYRDTHLAYTRLVAVNKEHPNLIAQQDLDTAQAKDAAADGALSEAKADVGKYETMVSYTRITAPFNGVVTKRFADPGALIQAGTASQTQAMPLVRVADNTLLRLDFPVSVDYVGDIKIGQPVSVSVESLRGKELSGKIARFTDEVDDSTRTMTVEAEVPNPTLVLVPGMYATVTLKTIEHPHALAVPIEAAAPGSKSVLVVDGANEVQKRTVTFGLETASAYEVLDGLNEGDRVMLGNPDQLPVGAKVEPQLTQPLAAQ
jgi:RND family efflux transporter MFP subunit